MFACATPSVVRSPLLSPWSRGRRARPSKGVLCPGSRNPRGSSCGRRAGIRAKGLFDAARAHLDSLLAFLQPALSGRHYSRRHGRRARRLGRWFPRPREYSRYVHWDTDDPSKYTRNVIHSSEEMEGAADVLATRRQELDPLPRWLLVLGSAG